MCMCILHTYTHPSLCTYTCYILSYSSLFMKSCKLNNGGFTLETVQTLQLRSVKLSSIVSTSHTYYLNANQTHWNDNNHLPLNWQNHTIAC